MKKVITVKTKLDKNDKSPKITALTLNFDGVTVEELIGPATDSLVITKQGQWRRAKIIPQTEEVSVKDMIARMGSRSQAPLTVEGIAAVATTLSPDDRKALVAKLIAEEKAAQAAAKPSKGGKGGGKADGERDRPQA